MEQKPPSPTLHEQASIGASFTAEALAPFEKARALLEKNKLGDGIRALEPEALTAGLKRGVEAVARGVSVAPSQIEALLPGPELEALSSGLSKAHDKVLKAIRRGDMTVVNFAVPKDVKADTLSGQLREVAGTFARDKEISGSLEALAEQTTRWQALVVQVGEGLETDPAIAGFRRRRVMLRAGGLGAAALAVAAVLGLGAWLYYVNVTRKQREEAEAAARALAEQQSRQRLEAAVQLADACAPDGLTGDDRKLATADQLARLEGRGKACDEARAKREREARCEQLASRLEAGQPSADDLALAGQGAGLLKRVADKALTGHDLLATDADLPCEGSPASARIWASLSRAAGGNVMLWGLCEGVSEKVGQVMSSRPGDIPPNVARSLSFRAETVAGKALGPSAHPGDDAKARPFCQIKAATGLPLGAACQKLVAK